MIDQDFGKQGMLGTEATATMREVGVRSLIVGFTGDSHEGHDKHARAVGQDYVLGPFLFRKKKNFYTRSRTLDCFSNVVSHIVLRYRVCAGKPFTDSAKLRHILQRLTYNRGMRGLAPGTSGGGRWGKTV